MAKIPLERTIGDTYGFAFRNFFSVLGVVWLPYLILAAGLVGAFFWIWPDIQSIDWKTMHGDDPSPDKAAAVRIILKLWAVLLPLQLFAIVMRAMITVGVQRKALGLHEGPVYAFFSLGSTVWRLIGAIILAILAIAAMALALVAAVAAITLFAQRYGDNAALLAGCLAGVIAFCWGIYFAVRLTFFIPPAVVAEGGLGLARSWQLGAGNFWRIVVLVLVAIFVPMIAIGIVNQVVFFTTLIGLIEPVRNFAESHRDPAPQEVFSFLSSQLKFVWPALVVYFIVVSVIILGLGNGMSAMAYRNAQGAGPAE